jgi:hypothetical protein
MGSPPRSAHSGYFKAHSCEPARALWLFPDTTLIEFAANDGAVVSRLEQAGTSVINVAPAHFRAPRATPLVHLKLYSRMNPLALTQARTAGMTIRAALTQDRNPLPTLDAAVDRTADQRRPLVNLNRRNRVDRQHTFAAGANIELTRVVFVAELIAQ